ncbi:haloacid dehalogenase [Massilia violaceinigra]|uniref:Haloacid dehalogenase n=1 Tax=Massilia violaceinigra TaxID=2045208 RepID=A0A2D2DVL0_9BURK|nr:cation-translocating P-type ATPase [Massilia violaceinigra]ATQ79015.1 haloacid dehalogenase [Massilia violaceinigra]
MSEHNAPVRPGPEPAYRQSVEAVAAAQHTDPRRGLDEDQAQQRLASGGRNELAAPPVLPAWRKLLAQFTNVLVLLLLGAGAVSTVLWLLERESALPYEALAILAIVLLNAVMGYVQESRAESAMAALNKMSANEAVVIRGGEQRKVPAAELVCGDLIVVEEGSTVPADARLIQTSALRTAEAPLTGESLPAIKGIEPLAGEAGPGDRACMVFSGTAVSCGRGKAIVTATGMQTEIGRVAGMLNDAGDDVTPLQKELDRVGKTLGLVVVGIAVVMIGTIILVQDVRGWKALLDVLILGVALAVAAVPEGLAAVVTVALALGVQRMARRHAIVRHLAAVETLGSANVIASDKTGTLTRNEMTVSTVLTASGRISIDGTGYEPRGKICMEGGAEAAGAPGVELARALAAACHVNNAVLQEHDGCWTVLGDPTEGALIVAARKAGVDDDTRHARFERVAEVPFSSERKLMSTLHRDAAQAGRLMLFTKGAPDVLLERCSHELVGDQPQLLTDARRAHILEVNASLAGQALRTLGVAERELDAHAVEPATVDASVEQALTFLGLIGMIDPPREEARLAVEHAKSAGIRPMMITGDHPATACVIAAQLGIATDGRAVTGAEIEHMKDAELARVVCEVSVYARVNPEHKLRIINALQGGGATVAMTGDGVNDAPALKSADIGVAMGITGTDVSKQAADIILADDNFATIVAAVEEGRAIFANIRKVLRYLLSSNIGEVMTMLFGVLLARQIGLHGEAGALALPLLATQILWINLVTDGAPALALAVDRPAPGLMLVPPRPRSEGVLTGRMWLGIFSVGAVMAAGTLLVLDAALPGGLVEGDGSMRHGQTMAFTTLVMFQLFNVFNARSDEHSAFCRLFQNPWIWAAVGLSLALHAAVLTVPLLQNAFSTVSLSGSDWLQCAAVASSVLWVRELGKLLARHRRR